MGKSSSKLKTPRRSQSTYVSHCFSGLTFNSWFFISATFFTMQFIFFSLPSSDIKWFLCTFFRFILAMLYQWVCNANCRFLLYIELAITLFFLSVFFFFRFQIKLLMQKHNLLNNEQKSITTASITKWLMKRDLM